MGAVVRAEAGSDGAPPGCLTTRVNRTAVVVGHPELFGHRLARMGGQRS